MNHKRRCIFGMRYIKDSDFIIRVREIQTMLSAPLFGTLTPAPSLVVPMLDQLGLWMAQSMMKDYRNVAARKALRAVLNDLVSAQCTSVNAIAQGDVNVLVQSGFDLIKLPSAAPVPEKTMIKSIKNINRGMVKVQLKPVPYYRFFELEIKGPDGFETDVTSPVSKVEIPHLPQGVRLSVVARAVNQKGRGLWSQPVIFVVNIEP